MVREINNLHLTFHSSVVPIVTWWCYLSVKWERKRWTSISNFVFHHQGVFPRTGPSHERRLQFCWRRVFHRKLRNQGCSFTRHWIDCGSFPLLSAPHSVFSIWTDLKRSRSTNLEVRRVDLGNLALRTRRNSPPGLNISSVRIFNQIRDPEVPITLRPHFVFIHLYSWLVFYTCNKSTTRNQRL